MEESVPRLSHTKDRCYITLAPKEHIKPLCPHFLLHLSEINPVAPISCHIYCWIKDYANWSGIRKIHCKYHIFSSLAVGIIIVFCYHNALFNTIRVIYQFGGIALTILLIWMTCDLLLFRIWTNFFKTHVLGN